MNREINEFFDHLLRLADESDRRFDDSNLRVAKYMNKRIKSAVSSIKMIGLAKSTLSSQKQNQVCQLQTELLGLSELWKKKVSELQGTNDPIFTYYKAKRVKLQSIGRPEVIIDFDQVRLLREINLSWTKISEIFSIHRVTLWRKLKKNGFDFSKKYSEITSLELDKKIKILKQSHPLSGEKMIQGFLRSEGLYLQRWKVRESIHRVDPINTANRWLRKNPRWIYSVPGPNSLWHNDGLHKLIHWGIVIHACIDGYSRMITSLFCATKNRAETCLKGFLGGVKKFGIPARVRGDMGGENVDIARYMREKQGYEGAYIMGPSVHNQRIERLHYDTTHTVLCHFIDLFLYLEESQLLNRHSQIDIFALQYVYVPRIQKSLDSFQEAWNNHGLSTERNQTPYQIWTLGMMDSKKSAQRGVRKYIESDNEDESEYGIDSTSDIHYEDLNIV